MNDYTDPPYERARARPCFELLAEHAPRLLMNGGSLVIIVPHYFLEEAIDIMRGALKFRWIYNMDQEERPDPCMVMGIEVCWQQAEAWAEYYIEKLTEPGDLVLDPFCGPGTVPAVCIRKGRKYIGVEMDAERYEQAMERIAL